MPNRTPDLEVLCLREIRFEPPGPQRRGLSWASVPRRGAGGAGEAGRGAHEREKTRGTLRWRPAATEARAMEASPCPPPHSALLRCPPSHSPLSPCFLAPVSAPVSLLPHPYPPAPSALLPHPGALPSSSLGPVTLLPHPCPGFPRSDRRIGKLRSGKSVIGPDRGLSGHDLFDRSAAIIRPRDGGKRSSGGLQTTNAEEASAARARLDLHNDCCHRRMQGAVGWASGYRAVRYYF